MVALLCLGSAAWASAQGPGVHYMHQGVMPPGAIGSQQLQRGGPLPGFFQPVQIRAPRGVMISLAEDGRFGPAQRSPVRVGLLIGQVYRIRVTNIPLNTGYEVFPTVEIIDRLYTPRLAGRVFRHLNGALAALGGGAAEDGAEDVDAADIDNGRVCTLGKAALVLPAGPLTVATVPLGGGGKSGVGRWIDLASGEIETVDWLRPDDGAAIALAEPRRCETPVLLVSD